MGMENFEKVFKSIKENVVSGVGVISKKSVEIKDRTKAKIEITGLKNKIEKQQCLIGEIICKLKEDRIEPEEAQKAVDDAYDAICECVEKIKVLEGVVDDTKSICPECGAKNAKEAKFCSECGMKFEDAADPDGETEEL